MDDALNAHVRVVALGGTIAMTSDGDSGVQPTLDADALVAAVPGLAATADVSTETFRTVPGASLRPEDLVELARHIAAPGPEVDGFVITQGTDTLESTAFVLDVLLNDARPVVVTGAMRPPAFPGADGPANVLAAVRTAASAAARGIGVVVVLDEVIHAARFVRKTHTSRPSAFTSPTVGPIGWISEENVRIPLRPTRPLHVDPATLGPQIAPVALVPVALGDRGGLLAAVAQAGYAGAVVEAFGAGHVPTWLVEELAALAETMPVVLTSLTGAGEVFAKTYGFAGSERDLLDRGLISGGVLDGPRARLLLSLLLTARAARNDIVAAFHRSSS